MAKISSEDKQVYIKTGLILSIIAICFLVWLWWVRIYTSKANVFNAMLINSLSTRGVTKTTSDKAEESSYKQVSQAQFGADNKIDGRVDISQPGSGGKIEVSTKLIATPNEDFMRYASINIPTQDGKPKVDFSSLYNQWAKSSSLEGGGSSFSELAYGMVLFGNLPKNQRDELYRIIKNENVYKTDFSKTEFLHENGRTLYKYQVEVNPKSFGRLVKKYDEIIGRKQMETLDPEQYANVEPITLTIKVDKISRTLVELTYQNSNGNSEKYGSFGVHNEVKLPQNTISRDELEAKLQDLLNKQQ